LTNLTQNPWTLIASSNSYGDVPLDQWNTDQQRAWDDKLRRAQHPEEFPNGFICPKDGGRLYDTGQMFLPSGGSPAKLRVKCMRPDCNYRGERFERVNRVRD
jgi:hypothetical protein